MPVLRLAAPTDLVKFDATGLQSFLLSVSEQLTTVTTRLDSLDARVSEIAERHRTQSSSFTTLQNTCSTLDNRLTSIDGEIARMEALVRGQVSRAEDSMEGLLRNELHATEGRLRAEFSEIYTKTEAAVTKASSATSAVGAVMQKTDAMSVRVDDALATVSSGVAEMGALRAVVAAAVDTANSLAEEHRHTLVSMESLGEDLRKQAISHDHRSATRLDALHQDVCAIRDELISFEGTASAQMLALEGAVDGVRSASTAAAQIGSDAVTAAATATYSLASCEGNIESLQYMVKELQEIVAVAEPIFRVFDEGRAAATYEAVAAVQTAVSEGAQHRAEIEKVAKFATTLGREAGNTAQGAHRSAAALWKLIGLSSRDAVDAVLGPAPKPASGDGGGDTTGPDRFSMPPPLEDGAIMALLHGATNISPIVANVGYLREVTDELVIRVEEPVEDRVTRTMFGLVFSSARGPSTCAFGQTRVVAVREGGPAYNAGIQLNDCIVEISQVTVKSRSDAVNIIRSLSPGTAVDVVVIRGENTRLSMKVRVSHDGAVAQYASVLTQPPEAMSSSPWAELLSRPANAPPEASSQARSATPGKLVSREIPLRTPFSASSSTHSLRTAGMQIPPPGSKSQDSSSSISKRHLQHIAS